MDAVHNWHLVPSDFIFNIHYNVYINITNKNVSQVSLLTLTDLFVSGNYLQQLSRGGVMWHHKVSYTVSTPDAMRQKTEMH